MKTLLNGVNSVLKRVQIIKGETGELTSLSQSTIQHEIDVCVQIWNEVMEELYSTAEQSHPQEGAKANITLVSGQREYELPSDCNAVRWPLMDNTNGYYIHEYEPGYDHLRQVQQIPSNYEGRPITAVINPQNDKIYMDYIPTSTEDGLVYEIFYDKDVSLSVANDSFPFGDSVFRALVPAVAEVWKLDQRKEFNESIYNKRLAQAGRYLNRKPVNKSYLPRRV